MLSNTFLNSVHYKLSEERSSTVKELAPEDVFTMNCTQKVAHIYASDSGLS